MPRLTDNSADPPPGELVLRPVTQGCVEVEYVPARERLFQAGVAAERVDGLHTRLLHIDALQGDIKILPINTNPKKENFLKPKYDQVSQIIIGGQSLVRLGRNRDPAATVGDQHGKIMVTELDRGVL